MDIFFAQAMYGLGGAYPVRGIRRLGGFMASYKIVMLTGLIISILGVLLMTSNTIYYNDTSRTFMELGFKLVIVALGLLIYKKGERMRTWSVDPNFHLRVANAGMPRTIGATRSYNTSSFSPAANRAPATSAPARPNVRHRLDISLNDRSSATSLAIFNRTRLLLLGQLNSHGVGIGHIKVNSTSDSSSVFEADIHPAGEVSLTRVSGDESAEISPDSAQPSIHLTLSALNISPDVVISMLHQISENLQKEFEDITVHESATAINSMWNTSQYRAAPSQASWSMKADAPGSWDQQRSRDMGLLEHTFSFEGRIRRITIWVNGILNSVLYLILIAISASSNSTGVTLVVFLGFIALGIRGFSLSVRRWHDLDKSGWWVLISVVPFGSFYALYKLGFVRGDDGPNQYGPAPEDGQLW